MWVFQLLNDANVIELDIQELVDALEGPADRDIVLQLHGYFVIHKRFEEAVRKS